MPIPSTVFENNDEAAHAVLQYIEALRSSSKRYTLRPYNQYLPKYTEWWLIPSIDWPAYRYSKLFIHKSWPPRETIPGLYVGYYVEKGLGQQLAGIPGIRPTQIMQGNWYWHEFIRRAKLGDFDAPIREVASRSGQPVVIALYVHEFNHVPKPDTERQAPHDWTEFVLRSPSNSLQSEQSGTELLACLNTCTNIQELAGAVETLKGLDFFWLDFLIGVRLWYGTRATGTWSAAELWQNALEPWNALVR